ncbi:MAG TPA: hypothetical protein PKC72_16340 [Chitinophagaceae bacterium]|nr:hypothetical protein [Chitinophagaceae bacterium]
MEAIEIAASLRTKAFVVSFAFFCLCIDGISQDSDTGFAKRVTSFLWVPDGNSLIVNIVKEDKSNRIRPVGRKYFYNFKTDSLTPYKLKESRISYNPNGRNIAFIRNDSGKINSIYVKDLRTNSEKLLIRDTIHKFGITWSSNGNKIAYNIEFKKENKTAIEICVYDLITKETKQITNHFPYFSYQPSWNPKTNQLVYFLEKGDGHDQIYLTDGNGSFHTNLTNDSTTHNYNPSWINEKTIIYTRAPDDIVVMNITGKELLKINGTGSTLAKYNDKAGMIALLNEEKGDLYIYDYKKQKERLILSNAKLENFAF